MTPTPVATVLLAAAFCTAAIALLMWAALEWAKFITATRTARRKQAAEQARSIVLSQTVSDRLEKIKSAPTVQNLNEALASLPTDLSPAQASDIINAANKRHAELKALFPLRN